MCPLDAEPNSWDGSELRSSSAMICLTCTSLQYCKCSRFNNNKWITIIFILSMPGFDILWTSRILFLFIQKSKHSHSSPSRYSRRPYWMYQLQVSLATQIRNLASSYSQDATNLYIDITLIQALIHWIFIVTLFDSRIFMIRSKIRFMLDSWISSCHVPLPYMASRIAITIID